MSRFQFTSRQRTFSIVLMAIGVLCLALTWVKDDPLHTRFWTNVLHNTMFFTGIAFTAVFALAATCLAYSAWNVVFKRIWEAYSLFLIVGLGLMLVIVAGVWGHFHHLYHWADAADVAKDQILTNKSSFLNPMWYTVGTIVVLGVWYFFAQRLRQLSVSTDNESGFNPETYRKQKVVSAIFLPIAGFSSAAMIWQWLMSLDAHWYSTMYAWYTTASWFVTMIAMTVLMILYLQSRGMMSMVTKEHLHDLGKFLFAFSIFWTYLWFSQFMLIWYSNNGEETTYFNTRMVHYPVLYWGNLILNFLLPFLILIRNDTKWKVGTLVMTCILIIFGHWIDFFQMIKPGALHTAHEAMAKMGSHGAEVAHHGEAVSHFQMGFTIPGLLEIGTLLGFAGLFLFFAMGRMAKAALVPKNDPFYEESLHHHA